MSELTQMNGLEVIEWFGTHTAETIERVFGYSSINVILTKFSPESIVDKIASYEFEETQKIKTKWVSVCRIIEVMDDKLNKVCVYEEDIEPYNGYADAEKVLKRYCKEHTGEFIAVMERVCRVKAVEE